MPDEDRSGQVIESLVEVLHAARHNSFYFQTNDHPLLDAGFNTGFMLGIHFAFQYPDIAVKMDKDVFPLGRAVGPNTAVDMVAEVARDDLYPRKELSEDERHAKWTAIGDKAVAEGEILLVKDEGYWPLPVVTERDETGGYSGA